MSGVPFYEFIRKLAHESIANLISLSDYYPQGSLFYMRNSILRIIQIMVDEKVLID